MNKSGYVMMAATAAALFIGYRISPLVKCWWKHQEDQASIYDNYIKIDYVYMDNMYSVRLPYREDKVADMAQQVVCAVNGDEYVDITQQPGLAYYVSPKDMKVDHFCVMQDEGHEIYHTAPQWCISGITP